MLRPDVTARTATTNGDHVEAQLQSGTILALHLKCQGGARETYLLPRAERRQGTGQLDPALDLDDGQYAAFAGNDIDFAQGVSPIAGENAIAAASQPPDGEC